jgi:hypothetical protein
VAWEGRSGTVHKATYVREDEGNVLDPIVVAGQAVRYRTQRYANVWIGSEIRLDVVRIVSWYANSGTHKSRTCVVRLSPKLLHLVHFDCLTIALCNRVYNTLSVSANSYSMFAILHTRLIFESNVVPILEERFTARYLPHKLPGFGGPCIHPRGTPQSPPKVLLLSHRTTEQRPLCQSSFTLSSRCLVAFFLGMRKVRADTSPDQRLSRTCTMIPTIQKAYMAVS